MIGEASPVLAYPYAEAVGDIHCLVCGSNGKCPDPRESEPRATASQKRRQFRPIVDTAECRGLES